VNIATYTKFTITIGTGLYAAGVGELPRSYTQALKALSYHFYTGGNGALGFGALTREREPVPEAFSAREQDLLFALRSGNKDKCIPLLEGMLDSLTAGAGVLPAPEYVESLCCELASKLFRVLLELFPHDQLPTFEARLETIKSAGPVSFQRLRELLLEFAREGCERVEGSRRLESRRIILEAMSYIRSHLHLDLSLEHCARQFNFSPGYFSNLFKKESGMSFQHFVIQEKMEKAKAMLLSDHQVQEIARELGYEHRRYFSEVFKKYTGYTPSEFREANL
jgi:two-component system response regulator YesN